MSYSVNTSKKEVIFHVWDELLLIEYSNYDEPQ